MISLWQIANINEDRPKIQHLSLEKTIKSNDDSKTFFFDVLLFCFLAHGEAADARLFPQPAPDHHRYRKADRREEKEIGEGV